MSKITYKIPQPFYAPDDYSFVTKNLNAQKVDWGLSFSNIPETWKLSKGKGVVVYVIDTAIDIHKDLKGQIIGSYNFASMNADKSHATFIGGLIAAKDNGIGVVGVAPEAKIISINVFNEDGTASDSTVAEGVYFAAEHKIDSQKKVINLSLGSYEESEVITTAINYAIKSGCIVVCACGNDGHGSGTLNYPAGDMNTIAVGSINSEGNPSNFNNVPSNLQALDILAPGENILSLAPNDSYKVGSGSSFATAFCSGVVALLLSSTNLKVTQDEVRLVMRHTARDLETKGYDKLSGFGQIMPKEMIDKIDVALKEQRPSSILSKVELIKRDIKDVHLAFLELTAAFKRFFRHLIGIVEDIDQKINA